MRFTVLVRVERVDQRKCIPLVQVKGMQRPSGLILSTSSTSVSWYPLEKMKGDVGQCGAMVPAVSDLSAVVWLGYKFHLLSYDNIP